MASKQSNVHLIHPMEAIHQSQIYHVMSWSNSAKSTWDACRYIILCSNNSIIGLRHYASLQVTSEEINQITIRTVDQGDYQSGEWVVQRRGHVTASTFEDIVRRKAAYVPLVARLLYSSHVELRPCSMVMIMSQELVTCTVNIFTNSAITRHLWKKQDFI